MGQSKLTGLIRVLNPNHTNFYNQTLSKQITMSRYSELKSIVDDLESDFNKFHDKNVDAAGARIRRAMLDLRNLANVIRKEVQEERNSRKSG